MSSTPLSVYEIEKRMAGQAPQLPSLTEAPPAFAPSTPNFDDPNSLHAGFVGESHVEDRPESVGLGGRFMQGMKQGLGGAIHIARNSAKLLDDAANLYAGWTGASKIEAFRHVKESMEDFEKAVTPTPEEIGQPSTVEKVAMGLGQAPVAIAKYGLATIALRNPMAAFAVADGLQSIDQGAAEALKSAAFGAATAGGFGMAAKVGSLPVRMGASAAVGAGMGAVSGGDLSDITANGVLGAVFGIPGKPATKKFPEGVQFVQQPKDVNPLGSWLSSPTVWSEAIPKQAGIPDARTTVLDTVMAQRYQNHLDGEWTFAIRRAFRKLSPEEGDRFTTEYLDNPAYTLQAPPPGKFREPFMTIRPLLDQIKGKIIETKNKVGNAETRNLDLALRGLQRQRQTASAQDIPGIDQRIARFEARRRALVVPSTWGIEEGYMPHGFGEAVYKITYDGAEIPTGFLAASRAKANQNIEKYLRLFPNADKTLLKVEELPAQEFLKQNPAGKGQRFFGFGLKRESNLPGWIAGQEGLQSYASSAARYVAMAPMREPLTQIQSYLHETMPKSSLSKMWDVYTDRVEGRPGAWGEAFNRYMISKGFEPHAWERYMGFIRSTEATLKLGFSPISAIQNLFQIPINTMPVIGARWTMTGFKGALENLATGKYNWLLEELHIRDAATKMEEASAFQRAMWTAPRNISGVPKYVWSDLVMPLALKMFSKTEYTNRAITAIGAYERARYEGMAKPEAVKRALDAEVRSQFVYGTADSSRLLGSPGAKTLLQFRSFWQKQWEFMLGLASKDTPGRFRGETNFTETARFLTGLGMAVGFVGIPGANFFDSLVETISSDKDGKNGISPMRWVKEKLEHKTHGAMIYNGLSRGLPGLTGLDFTQTAGFSDWLTPRRGDLNPADFAGPPIQEALMLAKWVRANPGSEKDEAFHLMVDRLSPMGRRAWDYWLSDAAKRGDLVDNQGRIVLKDVLKPGIDRAILLAGGTPIKVAEERKLYGDVQDKIRKITSLERGYAERIAKAMQGQDAGEVQKLATEAVKAGVPGAIQGGVSRLTMVGLPRLTTSVLSNLRRLKMAYPDLDIAKIVFPEGSYTEQPPESRE